ncbi:exo-alpha-sialidase [Lutibacter sp.]
MKILRFIVISVLTISCVQKEPIEKLVKIDTPTIVTETSYNAMGPYFNSDSQGNIILSWTEEIDTLKTNILKFKIFDGLSKKFGKTITVTPSEGMQSHQESMAKVAKNSKGILYAVFRIEDKNSKRRFAGSIYYSISEDGGNSWSEKRKLVNDVESASQSFYDIALLPDGELGICWLDSRKIEKDKDGSTLYFAKSNSNLGFVDEKPIAGSTCQCCRTDIYVSTNNNINIAFRNIAEGSIRDMYRTVSQDNGKTFSNPEPMGKDNWKIDGCPHTGPSFADNSKELAVTWFTGANSGIGIFFKKLTGEISIYENKMLITTVGRHPQMEALSNGNYYIVYEDYYKVGDQTYNNIVLHTIKENGTHTREVISSYNTKNDHAVLKKSNDNELLIAWVTYVGKSSKIVITKIIIK